MISIAVNVENQFPLEQRTVPTVDVVYLRTLSLGLGYPLTHQGQGRLGVPLLVI
jgi:hypothetical protein